jgi:tetratricopeptide (TPR) repeat protein
MINARLEELRSKFQENPRRYFAPFANELRKTGDPVQAISVCRAHLATQPGHVSGHIVLGQALFEAGQANEARDTFTAALELDPENLIALRSLGEISQVNGEFVAARQWYVRLLDADPRNTEVAQLLKDLPTENALAPSVEPVQAHAAETTLEEHKEQERSPFEPPAPAPSFHSGFTGPGPAYKTAEDLAEEARQVEAREEPTVAANDAAAASQVEFVDMDAEASEPAAPVAWKAESEAIEMVDLDSFTAEQSVGEPVSAAPEEPRAEAAAPTEDFADFSFASEESEATASEPEATAGAPEFAMPVDEASEDLEQPRALFAERGFDGPADDQIGWMMTPSAVESDLESAPENWFDAPSPEPEQVTAQQETEEQPAVEANEPSPATDSWFDDVPGAAVVVPTEGVTTDDFWLPPDLSQVPTTPVANAPEEVAEPFRVNASETESIETVAEDVAEEAVAHSDRQEETQSAEFVPPMEFATPDVDQYESAPSSSIEYFDHESSTEQADVHEEAPVSEWSDSLASTAEGEPQVQPVAEGETEAFAHHEVEQVSELYVNPTAEQDTQSYVEPVAEQESEPYVQPVAERESEPVESWASAAPEVSYSEPQVDYSEPSYSDAVEAASEAQPIESAAAPSEESEAFVVASGAPDEPSYPDPVIGHTPPMAAAEMQPAPAPFVTETLAELYLQQGFRGEALSIYRQLVERDPSNATLRDRMVAIERGEDEQRQSPVPQVAASERASSQSVRTFFSKLARRPAVGPSASASITEAVPASDVPFASAASALANLFAASKPPASDEGAAASLAGAYTNPSGRPSRAADRELSLDHLFRDVPPGGSQAGGMSLDEFYSTPNAETGSPTEPAEANEPPESGGADIRQFTAWLEGLRKK